MRCETTETWSEFPPSETPPGFLTDLSVEDQQAIEIAAKQPLEFTGYDDHGRAELEFTDSNGVVHFIYVDPVYIHPFRIR